jgi:hypothetical protein
MKGQLEDTIIQLRQSLLRYVLSNICQWFYFAVFFGLCILPASTEHIILFSELIALTSGYDHIKAIISSTGFLHKIFDLPFIRDSFQLRLTLQFLKRKLARVTLQALPITVDHLKEMCKFIDAKRQEDLTTWCSIFLGFFGLLRKKNLVTKILTVGNFAIDYENYPFFHLKLLVFLTRAPTTSPAFSYRSWREVLSL